MSSTARRRAMDALKRQRPMAPAGPLFAVEEEGAEFEHDTLDKVAVLVSAAVCRSRSIIARRLARA
jgi:RecJ-like exonuclease